MLLDLPQIDPAIQDLHTATAFYTHDHIVDELLDLAHWPDSGGRLLESGAGDGAILLRAVRRLTLEREDIAGLCARVEAWEIHPAAANAMRRRLAAHLEARGWTPNVARGAGEAVVREADFLAPGPTDRRYAVAVANPPYLRIARASEKLRAMYLETVPAHARADLLHAFLDRATSLLTDDGVLAWITSDRWLFTQNAADLRAIVGQRFGVESLRRITESAFYVPKTRKAGAPPRVHPVAVVLSGSARATRPLTREAIYPESGEVMPGTVPLGSVARIRLCPWLGREGVFVLPATDAAHFPSDACVPCVDTDGLGVNDVLRVPQRFALRTSKGVVPEGRIRAHLERTTPSLAPRARRNPCWLPPESWGWLPLTRDALLIPRIARRLRAVRLPAGVLGINHNMTVVSSTLPLAQLTAMLTTDEVQAWVSARAPRLEGDFYSLTTTLLRQIPVRLPT